jgi:hypothetical protein
MIIRHDVTAETYCPLPITDEALRRLQEAFRDHAPDVELELGDTDDGLPFVSVTVPGVTEDVHLVITRGEVTGPDGVSSLGWQMHRGGKGPLYEFATAREVAEFLGSGGPYPFATLGDRLARDGRVFDDLSIL